MKKLWIIIISVMTIVLIGSNTMYYITTKQTLVTDQEHQIEMMVNSIQNSIDLTQHGERLFEASLAEKLRTASISIQEALPPDIEDVSNEQLKELSKKLMLDDITLFKQTEDDFVAYKSSDPKEIGMKTKEWGGGTWNDMFSQLMSNNHNIIKPIDGFGEHYSHFWSGPMDTSASNPESIAKYGYYNDGTTNYLIDPYINDTSLLQYQKKAGVDEAIKEIIKDNPFMLEVAVINDAIFEEKRESYVKDDVTWYSSRMLIYGKYDYSDNSDQAFVKNAVDTNQQYHEQMRIGDKDILKSYFPLKTSINNTGDKGKEKLVVVVSSDYDRIQKQLNAEELKILLISLCCFGIGFILVWLLARYVRKQSQTLENVQKVYTENIESLYKTVKEYRHDFTNHMFALLGMCNMKNYDELTKYLSNVVGMTTQLVDSIQISIPAFSGLIQAKSAQASEKNIQFDTYFEGLETVKIDTMKSMDLVRIMGNIIDNAFRAVEKNNPEDRKVHVFAKTSKGALLIKISNNGSPIPQEIIEKIYQHGFTTKTDKSNSGMGLAIVRNLVEKYKGSIEVTSDPSETSFTIRIALSQRELFRIAS